ncbi:mitogen-activated protein kinase kinase kinase 7-interacting protein 3 homolog isoform X2 [Phymastichus coffea]|nr:mitogen-activated protein kinase kinase kinase 7-interacting protein 3 homolog isoform X2 [Phymastichus coffea]
MSEQRQNPQQQLAAVDPSKLRPLTLDVDTRSAAIQTSSQESSASSAPMLSDPFLAAQSKPASSFALSVNVNCSPVVEAHDLLTTCVPDELSGYQPILIPADPTPRSVTSVSLTLRPPSSEAPLQQPTTSSSIDISSQGLSSLTYSSSDPRAGGYQSHLQISIARNKRPKLRQPQRPNTLDTSIYDLRAQSSRPPGLPSGPANLLPPLTAAMSAPTTPSSPAQNIALPSSSLPTTPLAGPSTGLAAISCIPHHTASRENSSGYPSQYQGILADVPYELKSLVTNQLISRDRLAAVVAAEKQKLAALEQEVEMLNKEISPEEYERQLHSEIYHLQLECDKLADEVDRASGSRVPLGETSEEFYQNIYTGQQFVPTTTNREPPPLPSQPPAWEPQSTRTANQDEPEGPPWFCSQCTFANHPQIQKCELCESPRFVERREGNTQDIRIRVTHHHELPPRRTLNNWVI